MENRQIVVPPERQRTRLDLFLARELADTFSRTRIKRLIESGQILLNEREAKGHTMVSAGDQITFGEIAASEEGTRAEEIPIDVVYEDEDVIVVNKPAGMVVHPACGNPAGTLVNALLHHSKTLSKVGDAARPGIVHRLDKDTSGLLVAAKNDAAHHSLANQFKRRAVQRAYWAVVKGVVQHDEMRSEDPLGRSETNRKRVVVRREEGKPSVTNFRVLKRFKNATLLEARPETGRTHQIRVHLRALGYPVLGDFVYGVASQWISRQALHAKDLSLIHPTTKEKLHFTSDLPDDMKELLKHIEV